MIQAINIIRQTPEENLSLLKGYINSLINSEEINYQEYMELELLINLYSL